MPPDADPLSASTTCKGCGAHLTAADQETLVTVVQDHIAQAHPGGHRPTREQVLAVIQARESHGS